MKTLLPLLLIMAFGVTTDTNRADTILGTWLTPKQDGKIEFYKADNRYFAKLVWYSIPDATDIHNPNPVLRNKLVIGLNIFRDFIYDSKNQQWVKGTVYDPESGKTYACELWVDEYNPNQLKARGYVMGMTFLGRTETFKRIR